MSKLNLMGLVVAGAFLAVSSISPAHADGDAAKGATIFKKCQACHNVAAGAPNKVGPNLFGIVGKKAGTAEGFKYSDGLVALGAAWDDAGLDKWLADPKAVVPGTKMVFAGLKEEGDRKDVIAYLKTLK